MKKKRIAAVMLAASLALGTAALTGCNLIGGTGDNGQEQTEGQKVPVTGVTVSSPSLKLKVGASQTLTATVAPENATDKKVSWVSSKPEVAEVDESGKVTAKAVGTAKITVTTADGGKTDYCEVEVSDEASTDPVVNVTGVSLSVKTKALSVGASFVLTATVAPENAADKTVSWASSKPEVASVDQSGKITAKAVGTASITVTTNDGGKTDMCTVTVSESSAPNVSVKGISISPASATLEIGVTKKLSATVAPANATDKSVSWASDNTAVATVAQDGTVTAKAAGTANITATANDGSGVRGVCSVTVKDNSVTPVVKHTVVFYSEGVEVDRVSVENGKTVSAPSVTKDGYYLEGWATSNSSGALFDFTKAVTSDLSLYARWVKVEGAIAYTYAGNECAAFEWEDASPAQAKVEYKLTSASAYARVDSQLVRSAATEGQARVDVVGLQGGSNYDFKITTSEGMVYTVSKMAIAAHDRSGYAHFGKTDGVGAYNNDGTPKANANIVYFTEDNKNATVTVEGKECHGIVGVLTTKFSNPLIVRIIGTLGAATWNKLEHNGGNPITPDQVVGINGKALVKRKWTQEELIAGGYNTLDTSVYDELIGLSSSIKYDSKKDEFDSCWNDCTISGVKNVTVEGIGEDARIFQWGMTFKTSSSVEVRNLTFEDYTEDACSFEGGSSEDGSAIDGFKTKNFWIHHNTFEEGVNYWDVCNEQDKHDGDGSTDFKYLSNVTLSYNNYNYTHKTGLIGGSNSQHQANITFHHNYYNGCKSRLPLARQANMHMYNNYYHATTSTDVSLRAGAYAFIENCYFSSTESVNIDLQHDENNGDGAAKIVNSVFAKKNVVFADGVDQNHLYVGSDRLATVTNDNVFSKTFDVDSSVFYYDSVNKKSNVTHMLTAEETKEQVPKLAGVQKRGNSTGGGDIGGGEPEHEHTYADTYTSAGASGHYKMATCEHTDEHTAIEPHVYDGATDAFCNECGYERALGGGETFTPADSGYATGEDLYAKPYNGEKFSVTVSGQAKVTDMNFAAGGSGATAIDDPSLTFGKVFLSGGSTTAYTLTANQACTVKVYYTISDSKFLTTDGTYGKSGIMTVDGVQIEEDANTAGNKKAGTAYVYTLNLAAGQSVVLKSSANRFILFGIIEI